jgi:hypothetical protein
VEFAGLEMVIEVREDSFSLREVGWSRGQFSGVVDPASDEPRHVG